MKKFPKTVYVTIHKDDSCEWMVASPTADIAIDGCGDDLRIAIYELREVKLASITKTLV